MRRVLKVLLGKQGRFALAALLLILLLFAIENWVPDYREVPEDIAAGGTVFGGEASVTGVAWHKVGTPFSKVRWISAVVMIENTGPTDLRVNFAQIIMLDSRGNEVEAVRKRINQTYITQGDSRSIWAGGIQFPSLLTGRIEWTEIQVRVDVEPVNSVPICTEFMAEKYVVSNSEKLENGGFLIEGFIDDDFGNPLLVYGDVMISFFNEAGEFVGRGRITPNRETFQFSELFVPNKDPLKILPVHELFHGFFVNEEITDFQIDAIDGLISDSEICK